MLDWFLKYRPYLSSVEYSSLKGFIIVWYFLNKSPIAYKDPVNTIAVPR